MNTDNKLIFEAFIENNEQAYVMLYYSDRGMQQGKITTLRSFQLPRMLRNGAIHLSDGDINSVEVYEPEGVSFIQAVRLATREPIVFSCSGDVDMVLVFHDLQSVYNSLINESRMGDKTAKQIMQRLVDDSAVDYFYYGKSNHLSKPAHAVFYKTSAQPDDWYKVNSLNETGRIIGTTLSDAFGSRDFEQPEDPNREGPDEYVDPYGNGDDDNDDE